LDSSAAGAADTIGIGFEKARPPPAALFRLAVAPMP
jgi:hypothetical protein